MNGYCKKCHLYTIIEENSLCANCNNLNRTNYDFLQLVNYEETNVEQKNIIYIAKKD